MLDLQNADNTELRGQADLLKNAGDIFLTDSNVERALLFYDAAIDLYLRAGDTTTATMLCESVVSLAPNGVRALCTLAWLAVLMQAPDVTTRRIAQYADAAERANVHDRACRQLRCMAEECDSQVVLEVIAGSLLHLGDAGAANRVYSRIYTRNVPPRVFDSPADHARVVAARLTMALTL